MTKTTFICFVFNLIFFQVSFAQKATDSLIMNLHLKFETENFDFNRALLEQIDFARLPIFFFNLSKYFFLWAIIYHFFLYWEKLLKTETDKFELQAVLKETQYNNLKTQLNPHFLFNSLNGIRTLVDLDPENAKEAITRLSSLLRGSLKMEKHKTVTLANELQTVNDYLAIEKIRFNERLNTHFDIDPETLNTHLPPMMLQTLVENGIKHGISNLKNGGTIYVKTFNKNQNTIIQITNCGVYNPKHESAGLGIENTKERLRILFDDKAIFTIKNIENEKVLTEIIIPLLFEQDVPAETDKLIVVEELIKKLMFVAEYGLFPDSLSVKV